MAVLTADELAWLRRTSFPAHPVTWPKAQINAALQATEDYFETTARPGFGAAIEAAAPGVFTNAQKKRIVAYWLKQKFDRENVP